MQCFFHSFQKTIVQPLARFAACTNAFKVTDRRTLTEVLANPEAMEHLVVTKHSDKIVRNPPAGGYFIKNGESRATHASLAATCTVAPEETLNEEDGAPGSMEATAMEHTTTPCESAPASTPATAPASTPATAPAPTLATAPATPGKSDSESTPATAPASEPASAPAPSPAATPSLGLALASTSSFDEDPAPSSREVVNRGKKRKRECEGTTSTLTAFVRRKASLVATKKIKTCSKSMLQEQDDEDEENEDKEDEAKEDGVGEEKEEERKRKKTKNAKRSPKRHQKKDNEKVTKEVEDAPEVEPACLAVLSDKDLQEINEDDFAYADGPFDIEAILNEDETMAEFDMNYFGL